MDRCKNFAQTKLEFAIQHQSFGTVNFFSSNPPLACIVLSNRNSTLYYYVNFSPFLTQTAKAEVFNMRVLVWFTTEFNKTKHELLRISDCQVMDFATEFCSHIHHAVISYLSINFSFSFFLIKWQYIDIYICSTGRMLTM